VETSSSSSSSSSVGIKIPSAGITTKLQGENQLETSSKLSASNEEEEFIISNNNSSSSRKGILNSKNEAITAMAATKEATEKGDITGMCSPSSKLGQFYKFLSFSHLILLFQCELQTNPHTHPPHTRTHTQELDPELCVYLWDSLSLPSIVLCIVWFWPAVVRWSLKQSVVVDHNKHQECDFFVLDVRFLAFVISC
jgi:hypothetical protein